MIHTFRLLAPRTFAGRLFLLTLAALLLATLAACGGAEPTATPTLATEPLVEAAPPVAAGPEAPTPTPVTRRAGDIVGTGAATTAPIQKPEYGGALVFYSRQITPAPDPYTDIACCGNIVYGWLGFNSLVQQQFPYDPAKGVQYEPGLATSWSQTEDGSKWVFKLREGVTWHDGEVFNADDVVATVQKLTEPGFPLAPRVVAIRQVFKGAKKVDNYTVVLDTGQPNAAAYAWITSHLFVMTPEHLIKGNSASSDPTKRWRAMGTKEGETGTLAVGTGPFAMKKFDPEAEVVLERYPSYWKKDESGNSLPYLDKYVLLAVPDGTRQLANFVGGRIHYSLGQGAGLHPDRARELCASTRDKQCYTQEWPHGFFMLVLNHVTTEGFKNPKVATAGRYAIDHEDILRLAYGGRQGFMWMDRGRFPDTALTVGEQQKLLPWSDPARREEFKQKGKDLVRDAGYPNGIDLPLPIFSGNLCSGSFLDHYSRMVDQLWQAGIKGFLECRQGVLYTQETRAGRFSIDGPGDSIFLIDPGYSLVLDALLDSATVGDAPWSYPGQLDVDRLYRQLVRIVDEAKRNEQYRAIERYLADEKLTVFPSGFTTVEMAVHGCVRNFRPGGTWDSRGWSHEKTWLTKECR